MGRVYGRIACSIWDDDDDFLELSVGAQRTYLMLSSQADISACGTLPLTVRRWQRRIREADRQHLQGWLDELVAGRFVIIDEDTEELLVRTFVKWDGGHTNPKRTPAIHGAAKSIRSRLLRAVLAVELRKLGLVPQFEEPETADLVVPDIPAGQTPTDTVPIAYPTPTDTLLVSPSSSSLHPESFILEPTPLPTASAASAFDTWWTIYPKKAGKDAARRAFTKAIKRVPLAVVMAGTERYRDDPNLPERQFIPDPATWLNAGRWDDEPLAPRGDGRGRPSIGDSVRRNIDVAEQMQARADAARQQTIPPYRTAIA